MTGAKRGETSPARVEGFAPSTAKTTLFAGGYPLVPTAPCLRTPPLSMGVRARDLRGRRRPLKTNPEALRVKLNFGLAPGL